MSEIKHIYTIEERGEFIYVGKRIVKEILRCECGGDRYIVEMDYGRLEEYIEKYGCCYTNFDDALFYIKQQYNAMESTRLKEQIFEVSTTPEQAVKEESDAKDVLAAADRWSRQKKDRTRLICMPCRNTGIFRDEICPWCKGDTLLAYGRQLRRL